MGGNYCTRCCRKRYPKEPLINSCAVIAKTMTHITYLKLNELTPTELLPLLNKQRIRAHLVDHPLFDAQTVTAWLLEKIEIDASPGCKVRAVLVDQQLAGWCGIQFEEGKYGIALVLDDAYWGLGRQIFRDLMGWAKALGHTTVFIQLLYTRPEYRFLRKIAKSVYQCRLMGNKFTTYELRVE